MERISFSDGIGIAGIVLAILTFVLDKAGKLKGGWLFGLLFVAGLMTLFLAVGNSWVLDAPAKWRVWRGILMFSLVAFSYSGMLIWISSPSPELAETRPSDSVQQKQIQDDKPPTLVDLFRTDVPSVVKLRDDSVSLQLKGGGQLITPSQAYLDFQGKSEFVGFYVPSSPKTFDACVELANGVRDVIDNVPKRVAISAGYRDQLNSIQDLTFSGRVLLYHEDPLSITQKAMIIEAYKKKHCDVQFRGPDYLGDQIIGWHHQHDPKPAAK